jgi:hypothetical protein
MLWHLHSITMSHGSRTRKVAMRLPKYQILYFTMFTIVHLVSFPYSVLLGYEMRVKQWFAWLMSIIYAAILMACCTIANANINYEATIRLAAPSNRQLTRNMS